VRRLWRDWLVWRADDLEVDRVIREAEVIVSEPVYLGDWGTFDIGD
jgi:hypothetical protein